MYGGPIITLIGTNNDWLLVGMVYNNKRISGYVLPMEIEPLRMNSLIKIHNYQFD